MKEQYMSGREVSSSGDQWSKALAYFSPYLFWAAISVLSAGIWFFAA